MHDITGEVQSAIGDSGASDGVATVFVMHTTAAIIVSEYEPGIIADIHVPLQRIAPSDAEYRHNALNADDNAHSHLTGSIIGPSQTIPFTAGRLTLGTWQRVALLELDTRPRSRKIVVQVMGE
jgi:secondary thiamine-phosphate synthase enzyme